MAKQSIFGRIAQLAKANINALIDGAENPQLMLDQLVRDYSSNIQDAESAIAETIGNLRMLEEDHLEDVAAAADWGNKALAASALFPQSAAAATSSRWSSSNIRRLPMVSAIALSASWMLLL